MCGVAQIMQREGTAACTDEAGLCVHEKVALTSSVSALMAAWALASNALPSALPAAGSPCPCGLLSCNKELVLCLKCSRTAINETSGVKRSSQQWIGGRTAAWAAASSSSSRVAWTDSVRLVRDSTQPSEALLSFSRLCWLRWCGPTLWGILAECVAILCSARPGGVSRT